jgi:hypothetical protein
VKLAVTILVAVLIGLVVGFWPEDAPPPYPYAKLGKLVLVSPPAPPAVVAPVTSEAVEPLPASAQQYGAPGWEKTRAALSVDLAILVNTPPGEERD